MFYKTAQVRRETEEEKKKHESLLAKEMKKAVPRKEVGFQRWA